MEIFKYGRAILLLLLLTFFVEPTRALEDGSAAEFRNETTETEIPPTCPAGQAEYVVKLRTDSYGEDTTVETWMLDKNDPYKVESLVARFDKFKSHHEYILETSCLEWNRCYRFSIIDSMGDGFLDHPAYFEGFVEATSVFFGDDLIAFYDERFFCIGANATLPTIGNDGAVEISDMIYSNDPLASANDWAYEMIHIKDVWNKGYKGTGVRIRINDAGVDVSNNPDFENRFDLENSCVRYEPQTRTETHGTKIAGIVAANKDNGHCAVGIAHGSTFSSCNVYPGTVADLTDALTFKLEGFDISQNSIGTSACTPATAIQTNQEGDNICPFTAPLGATIDPCNPSMCDYSNPLSPTCETAIIKHCQENYESQDDVCLDFIDVLVKGPCNYDLLPMSLLNALQKGIRFGRDGKGIIFVLSSGNTHRIGVDINMSAWTNNRYTITAGAVGKDGLHAIYSTPGAALSVSAPVGDLDDGTHLMTTGRGGTCTNSNSGTSYAAPLVSGVIALMLEANPELTWRDVQGILAQTSNPIKNDPNDEFANTNAAGFWHSNYYGFGIIDAKKAVDAAETWELWTKEQQVIGESPEVNAAIPNDGKEFESELILPNYQNYTVESVVVLLNLQHYNRGDLELTLISPSETESVLHPGKRPEGNQIEGDERWKLMTVRNWGENPSGVWRLKVRDLVRDNTDPTEENIFRNWAIVVYGRTDDGEAPLIVKEEITEDMAFVTLPIEMEVVREEETEEVEDSSLPLEAEEEYDAVHVVSPGKEVQIVSPVKEVQVTPPLTDTKDESLMEEASYCEEEVPLACRQLARKLVQKRNDLCHEERYSSICPQLCDKDTYETKCGSCRDLPYRFRVSQDKFAHCNVISNMGAEKITIRCQDELVNSMCPHTCNPNCQQK